MPPVRAPDSPPDLRLVFWELTARCNLRCRHCRAAAGDRAAPGELTAEEALAAARDIRAAGDPLLILTGGEPLMRPDFFPLAEACCGLFSRVALATNGTRVDERLARRIVDSGIRRVSISLDGADAETHDRFRGQAGSFAAALRGYDALRHAGMSMQINVTVTRHNEGQLETLLQLAADRGADAFHLFMLVPVGCGAEIADSERLDPQRADAVLRWLAERALTAAAGPQVKATCAPQYYRILHELARARGLALPGPGHGLHAFTRGCLAGSAVCFVSHTGDVQPCGYLPLAVGNLRHAPLADLWRAAPVFQALRDPGRLKGKCGRCGYRRLCQGCRARAHAETGDFLAAEPDCPYLPAGGPDPADA